MILFLRIVVFRVKKLLNLSISSSADLKCDRFIFKLLPIKFLINSEGFHIFSSNKSVLIFLQSSLYISNTKELRLST